MNKIAAEAVEKTWQQMATMSVGEGRSLAQKMTKEQPFVQTYLLAVGQRDFNPDEAQLLFYLGMVVWQVFARSGQPLSKLSGDVLDRCERANMKMLDYLEDEPMPDFTRIVESLTCNYNQIDVLRYVVEALMEEPEEECDIREESVGIMLIHLKTVIDCLDQGK